MQNNTHQYYFDGEGVLCFVKLLALFLQRQNHSSFFYLMNTMVVLQAKHISFHKIGMFCSLSTIQLQWFFFA